MKKRIWICLIPIFFLGWYALNEYYWKTCPTVRLALGPVDPYDPLRGRYFILNPLICGDIEKELEKKGAEIGSKFYVLVEADSEGISRLKEISLEKLSAQSSGQTVMKGRISDRWRRKAELNLERFYLPAGLKLPHEEREQGWELEAVIRPDGSPAPKALWFKGERVFPR